MSFEHLILIAERQLPVLDDDLAGDNRVPGTVRAATQPRLDRVRDGAGIAEPLERPGDDVAADARREQADLAGPAEAARRAGGRHVERVPRRHPPRPATQPAEEERGMR